MTPAAEALREHLRSIYAPIAGAPSPSGALTR